MCKRLDIALLMIRIVISWRMINGVYPYIFNSQTIHEVVNYFSQLNLPQPVVCAYASVYAQFVCGIAFVTGTLTQYAGIVMAFNFLVAIFSAHLNDTIEVSFPAMIIFANSILFTICGGGKYAVDSLLFPLKK